MTEQRLQDVLTLFENRDWIGSVEFNADNISVRVCRDVYRMGDDVLRDLVDDAVSGWMVGVTQGAEWNGVVYDVENESRRGVSGESVSMREWIGETDVGIPNEPVEEDFASEICWHDEYIEWRSVVEDKFFAAKSGGPVGDQLPA